MNILDKTIAAIGNLDNNDERIKYYERNFDILHDYKMVFVDTIFGVDKTEYLNKFADFNYDVNSLYYSNKLLYLNETVLRNKHFGRSTFFGNQVSVSFDLQIVSQLKNNNLDSDLIKIIDLCKSGQCAFDIMPFLIENYFKRGVNSNYTEQDIEDIRAFETMFPFKRFSYDRGMPIEQRMCELLAYHESEENKQTMFWFFDRYKVELLYLLSIIHIHFKHDKLSPKNKFEKFLDFCDGELKAFHICAVNLAKLFYDNVSLRFFRKIQKNNPNLLKDIENMAWDLFHLKNLETSARIVLEKDILPIPIFISKDKGLNEIRTAYQIKCFFQNEKTQEMIFHYQLNSMGYGYSQKYYDDETVYNKRKNSQIRRLEDMIDELKKLISA